MRRCLAGLAVVTLTLLSLLAAAPASAGGPTSVLLVVPGAGQTASLYTGDADYDALAQFVGAFAADGSVATGKGSAASHASGTGVTATWLIHDVQVWRVDRIYLLGGGVPWISTQVSLDGSTSIWDSPAVWHRASDGQALVALLGRLGVDPDATGPATVDDRTSGDPTASDVAPTAAADRTGETVGAATGSRPATRLLWAIAGLALGVVGTLAAARLRPRGRSTSDENPTVDAAAAAADSPAAVGEPTWSISEELSSPARRR